MPAISRGSRPQRFAGAALPLLYLAGEDRSGELAVPGRDASGPWWSIAPPRRSGFRRRRGRRWQQGGIDGVLHFSRRSVESYLDCGRGIAGPALKPMHYCLSARAAEPLRPPAPRVLLVAARPDEASLLALVTSKVMPKP